MPLSHIEQTLPISNLPRRIRGLSRVGLVIFAALLPLENVIRLPVLGSLGRISGIVLLALALPSFFVARRLNLRAPSPTLLLLGAFTTWATASLLWSHDIDRTLVYASTVIQLFVLASIVWNLCRTDVERLMVFQAYVFGACGAIISALWNMVNGKEAVFGRYSATGTDPNDFALMVVLAVPMAWEIASRGKSRIAALNFFYLPIAVVAVIISGSRGGAIALAVALLVAPLGFRRLTRTRRRTLYVIASVGTATVPFLWARLSTFVSQNLDRLRNAASDAVSGSLNVRDVIWAIAADIFGDNPILGVGGGAFISALESESGMAELAHNTLLSVAVELGIVGLCLFSAALISTVFPLVRSNSRNAFPSLLLVSILIVGSLALTWEIRKPTWIVLVLASAYRPVMLSRIVDREGRVGPEPPDEQFSAHPF